MRALLLLGVALLAFSASATEERLPAFTSVEICTPFNVVLAPSRGKTYALTVDGDPSVAPAIDAEVTDGVLSLQSKGSFTTQKPVKITVRLPVNQLEAVTVSSAAGIVVVVDSGFSVDSFTGTLLGAADLRFNNFKANSVKLIDSGTGTIVFSGSVRKASVQASGTGTVYVNGISQAVAVDASGTSTVLINAPSQNVRISGQASGISTVKYNRGSCSVTGSGLAKPCLRGPVRAPVLKTQWTCGLQLSGTFGCSTGGSSSSTSGNGNAFGSTSTSGSGSFSSSSSSSSSGGGSFFSSSSSDGGGSVSTNSIPSGSSTLTTNTGKLTTLKCTVGASALKMT